MASPLETAEIIAVGSELITPHRIDTNSLFLTGRLNDLGIVVRAKAVVGDDHQDLAAVFRGAFTRSSVVVLTGGLGPTADDITRDVVSEMLGLDLLEDPGTLAAIEARFARRGVRMPEINRRQARAPRGAVVLANANGTAPGLYIEQADKVVVLLPGPPRELQPIFDQDIAPRIAARTQGRRLVRRVIKVTGRSESQVEEIAFPIYSKFGGAGRDASVSTTILAAPGQIELHLLAASRDVEGSRRLLDAAVAELSEALGPAVFSTDGRSLEGVVGELLRAKHLRIAVAESCTGGLVLGRLTDVSGSSAWVAGGIVAYDNAVKVDELGVSADLIDRHGAVSEPVAIAMAEGIRSRLRTEVGVGVTGIAGPTGGSAAKPVGTVVIAVAYQESTVRTFVFPGDREFVRRHSTAAALDMTRRAIE